MKVPLTIVDHLERAEVVYGRRTVLLDEPDQLAASWGGLTAAEMAARARAQAAALDDLGVGPGRAGGDREPQLGAAAHRVLGCRACTGGCSCRSTSA